MILYIVCYSMVLRFHVTEIASCRKICMMWQLYSWRSERSEWSHIHRSCCWSSRCHARACMYVSYVRQALRPITPRACTNGAESAIFEIHFYRERKLWGKKDLLLRSGPEPGSDALQTTAFATEPMGLWQLWTANLALILLTAAVSVDYSERPWPSGISGESQQTQALQGILTVLF